MFSSDQEVLVPTLWCRAVISLNLARSRVSTTCGLQVKILWNLSGARLYSVSLSAQSLCPPRRPNGFCFASLRQRKQEGDRGLHNANAPIEVIRSGGPDLVLKHRCSLWAGETAQANVDRKHKWPHDFFLCVLYKMCIFFFMLWWLPSIMCYICACRDWEIVQSTSWLNNNWRTVQDLVNMYLSTASVGWNDINIFLLSTAVLHCSSRK